MTTSKAAPWTGCGKSRLTTHATALGKVLLANNPYVGAELKKRELVAFMGATITDHARLEREFAQVRKWGWASEIGELSPDQVSIAAPIVDRRDAAVGAIAIFGRPERLLSARKPRSNLLGYVREAPRARVPGARGDPLVILGERAKDQSRDKAAAEQPSSRNGNPHRGCGIT